MVTPETNANEFPQLRKVRESQSKLRCIGQKKRQERKVRSRRENSGKENQNVDSIGSPKECNLTGRPSVRLDRAGEQRIPYGRCSAYYRAAQFTMMQQWLKMDQEANGVLVDGMNEMQG